MSRIDYDSAPSAASAPYRARSRAFRRTARIIAVAVLALYGVGLAAIVLLPGSDHATLSAVQRFSRWLSGFGLPFERVFPVVEFAANVALFVPFGVVLPLALGGALSSARRPRWWLLVGTVALGALLSTAIELAQRFIPGRVSDPRDVVANTLGTLCGVVCVTAISALVRSRYPDHMTAAASETPARTRRPLLKSARFWVPLAILLLLLLAAAAAVGVAALKLMPRVTTVQTSLQAAMPLATQAKDEILAGDAEAATLTVEQLTAKADEAVAATDGDLWRFSENIPVVGENLRAARLVSESVRSLSTEVFAPATGVNLSVLKPVDGAFDVAGLSALQPVIEQAATSADRVSEELASIDQDLLVEPLRDGVVQLDDAVNELTSMVDPASTVLQILPAALGADGPRNYLLMFPNNAEIRAGGGNPAALALITADQGRISITQQASSADFPEVDQPLNPEAVALYGNRTRMHVQDVTYTPYFSETAVLMRGFWAARYGTQVDAVVSFDPVALSYLLEATGPVTLDTGDVLTSENAVPLLLNEVYIRYGNEGDAHDAFFASATQSIFSGVLSGSGDMRSFVSAFARAADEGRLMYSSSDASQMELIGSSRVAGPLPTDNSDETVVGVFYNYVLAAKIDYYMDQTVTGSTTQCTVESGEAASFTATTTLTNILTSEELSRLPWYITGTNLGQGGSIYRDVLVYGPVGATVESVTVDGTMRDPQGRWGNTYREMTHNGRPVVQVPMFVGMQETASVSVTFRAAADQPADSFGDFTVRATPTVRTTPVEVQQIGC